MTNDIQGHGPHIRAVVEFSAATVADADRIIQAIDDALVGLASDAKIDPDRFDRQEASAEELFEMVDELRQALVDVAYHGGIMDKDVRDRLHRAIEKERDFHESRFGPSASRDESLVDLGILRREDVPYLYG